jgi:hypothetical protein
MVRAAPKVIQHGTAKQLADVGVGYTASGASEHSRNAAHSANDIKLASHTPRKQRDRTFGGPRYVTLSLGEKIAFQTSALAKLNIDLILEKNSERRAKLQKNIAIKSAFLERLKTEAKR